MLGVILSLDSCLEKINILRCSEKISNEVGLFFSLSLSHTQSIYFTHSIKVRIREAFSSVVKCVG